MKRIIEKRKNKAIKDFIITPFNKTGKSLFKKLSTYLYILPSIIILTTIFIYPLFQNLYRSFFRYFGGEGIFLGFDNYRYLILEDSITRGAILHNIQILLVVPILLLL